MYTTLTNIYLQCNMISSYPQACGRAHMCAYVSRSVRVRARVRARACASLASLPSVLVAEGSSVLSSASSSTCRVPRSRRWSRRSRQPCGASSSTCRQCSRALSSQLIACELRTQTRTCSVLSSASSSACRDQARTPRHMRGHGGLKVFNNI